LRAAHAASLATVATIDALTLRTWLNDAEEIALFDVREAGQFGEGHLFFAVPLPYSRLELDVTRLAPRRDVRVVLVDDGDGVAGKVARRLASLGYTQVSVLAQGVHGWRAAGYTLFKGVNLPSKTFGELVEHAYDTPHISASELARRQAAGEKLALLDGRTFKEHRKMTIPGAVNCPNGELAYRLDELVAQADTTIVVHCAGRTRSIMGAQTLRNLGVENRILALENGTQGWFLAGLQLEHGSTRRYPEAVSDKALEQARWRVAALRERGGVTTLTARAAQDWLGDARRTTLVLDVRTPDEFARDPVTDSYSAPGGQLLQATDQYIGVRKSRVLLIDDDGVRAPVIAHWLVQMGIEAAVVAPETRHDLRLSIAAATRSAASLPRLDAAALRTLVARDQAFVLIDLRSSAQYRRGHASGAHWAIRPTLDRLFAQSAAKTSSPVVLLFADSTELAELAALDLQEAGAEEIYLVGDGLDAWHAAGLPIVESAEQPDDSERIDYLFFVHDRHEGNAQAARDYLAWETGLLAQCAPDELAVFKIAHD
jgi:rhodanese-related sulfurtransferase